MSHRLENLNFALLETVVGLGTRLWVAISFCGACHDEGQLQVSRPQLEGTSGTIAVVWDLNSCLHKRCSRTVLDRRV